MDRVRHSTPATISATWYQDGEVADPGAVTVTIVREDGTELVAPGTDAVGGGAAPRTFDLDSDDTSLLDLLTATWSSAALGDLVTEVEVVGGFYFAIAEARKRRPLDDDDAYPAADIVAARTAAEQAIEDALAEGAGVGLAFVPRYRRERHMGVRGKILLLDRVRPRALRMVTIDGAALTGEQLGEIALEAGGGLVRPDGWDVDTAIEITYEHGYPSPPGRVAGAAITYARSILVDRLVDDRATRVSVEGGTISFATAAGEAFDLPELNAIVRRYARRNRGTGLR